MITLRYDKLGTGTTGLGPYRDDLGRITLGAYRDEALAAYRFLSAQPQVRTGHVAIVGHSEGALFALALATGRDRAAVHPAALALLEPLSQRYLTLIQGQLDAPIGRALAARQLSATAAAGQRAFVARMIAYVRAHGVAPPRLPSAVAQLFSPVNTRFLAQADRLDPAQLVAELPARLPVLISCSDTDQNIGCANVERLSAARPRAALGPGLIHQRNAGHELALTAPRSAPSTAIPTPLPRTAALPRALAKLFSAQR